MTDQEKEPKLGRYIELVRIGSYTEVLQTPEMLQGIKDMALEKDAFGAQSSAILAEIYDQVGEYRKAQNHANADIGATQLDRLEQEIRRVRPQRRIVRAHAWLLLQCAVSEFRREGGYKNALALLDKGVDLITAKKGEALGSQHIQSLFLFWRARIKSTTLYQFGKADEDFAQAFKVVDETLEEKLKQAEKAPREEAIRQKNSHVAASNYVLSTILSFGLAQARQLESRLLDSLWFLRAAVPLSRGSKDLHRQGFAHLLMGTALRGISHGKDHELDLVDDELDRAQELLNGDEPHKLHLARVSHQMALARYTRVPSGRASTGVERRHLEEALKLSRQAASWIASGDYKDFRDPLLDYGIKVTQSLIETGLGNFVQGFDLASAAIQELGRNVPHGTHGWALVARGVALSERAQEERENNDGLVKEAETALKEATDDDNLRPTDRGAAHLHLSRLYTAIGQPFQSAIHFDRAKPLVAQSEHGWVKDLLTTTEKGLKGDTGPELRINIQDLISLARDHQEGPWDYISKFLDIDVKRRLLSLPKYQGYLEEKNGDGRVAEELGISRGTLFNWKKQPELKDLFYIASRRKERSEQ